MRIAHYQLTKGKRVWYHYQRIGTLLMGPFTVDNVGRGVDGPSVLLSGAGGDRRVSLADDEDYGLPLFYDRDPTEPE